MSYNELRTMKTQLRDIERRMREASGAPRMSYSSIHGDDGGISEYDSDGHLVFHLGGHVDGTYGAVDFYGPEPHAPTTPTVAVRKESLTVTWNGSLIDGDGILRTLPFDFSCVQILGKKDEAPGPNDVLDAVSSEAGAARSIVVTPGEWHVSLRTRTKSGRMSTLTAPVIVAVPSEEPIVWTDLTLASGVSTLGTNASRICKIGHVVHVQLSVSVLPELATGFTNLTEAIPEEYRPLFDELDVGYATTSGSGGQARIAVSSSGVISSGAASDGAVNRSLSFQYVAG